MLSALQGGLIIEIKIKGSQSTLNAGLFGEQVAASLLNAAAFAPNNYPDSLSQVQSIVRQIWISTPSSKNQAQNALNGVTNQLSALNINH